MNEFKVGDIVYIPEEQVKGVIVKIEPNGTTCHVDKTCVGLLATCRLYESDQLVLDTGVEIIDELAEIIDPPDHKIMKEWLDSLCKR